MRRPAPSSTHLDAALAEARPRLSEVFERYGVGDLKAAGMIEQTMLALLYKWEGIQDPSQWLVQTLERKCRRWAQRQAESLMGETEEEPDSPEPPMTASAGSR